MVQKKDNSWSGLFGRVYDNSKGMGKTVQQSSVKYARMRVTVTSIIGTIIGIGLLIFSIIAFIWAGKYDTAEATITCITTGTATIAPGDKCKNKNVLLSYKGKNIIPFNLSDSNDAIHGGKVKISFLKKKPHDKDNITDKPVPWKIIAIVCLVLSLIIIAGVWIQYYMVQNSEVAATATAASNVMSMFK